MADMDESCSTCRFFARSVSRGVCRRRPPVWTGPDDSHDEGMFAFPSVPPHSWCGEYEHGEVQSMLQAVREAESDGMLTTEEAEAFHAVRPEATAEPVAWWIVPPYPAEQKWKVVLDKEEAERYRNTHFLVRPLYEHPQEGQ